ncbi:hypothetical protein GE09DRAFT_137165 [Coniochaeta sp. 2T2.1]|nr:hypothetical protein GE09DRAFT_137165 [Coniochaeta sp. 2T2.1]
MALTKTLVLLLPLAAAHSPLLLARAYLDEVCKPLTKSPSDTVPPCVEIETIETLCIPNGTAPIYLAAHQQCMCGGSYFAEWPACQSCLLFHGLRSEREVAQYHGVLSAASSSFCDAATPTAIFADVFASVQSTFPVPTTGGTVSSDRAKGETAVSLYYTAAGKQGPGQITGSAATATPTTTTTQRVVTTPTKSGTTGGAGGGGSGSQTTGGGGGAAGPGTTATRGPSGSGTASPSPSGNAAVRMEGASAGVAVVAAVAAVGLVF